MSATQGRFTSPDKPFADQHAGDPQSWNLYSYVRSSPLIYKDPTGRCRKGDVGKYHDSDEGPCVEPSGTTITVTEEAPKQRDPAAEVQAEMTRMQYEAWKRNQERNKPKEDQPLREAARQSLELAYQRTAHDLGCVGLGALITGGAGAASAPVIPKPFSAGGTSTTSVASTVLGGLKTGKSFPTPVGMPGTSSFAWRASADLGRIAGRYLPYVGLTFGAAATYGCLSTNP